MRDVNEAFVLSAQGITWVMHKQPYRLTPCAHFALPLEDKGPTVF